MDTYSMDYKIRWADIDANRHVNYAAYIEAATELRYKFFIEHDLPPEIFEKMGISPTYTSMLVNFYREVRMGETITINFLLTGLSEKGIRWRIKHDFFKANHKKAVQVLLEGTIINLETRQPVVPTPEIMNAFLDAPRSADFAELPEMRWFGK
jgi:acyl-CoA thioester hydrolase